MRDDGVVQVDGVHDVPHYTVGVQGHFVTGEAGQPLGHPGITAGGDLVGQFLVRRALLGALSFQLVDELSQGELGVPQDGIVGTVVLVNVAVAVGQVDQGLAGGHGHRETALGEAHANTEDHIGVGEEAVYRSGLTGTAHAE